VLSTGLRSNLGPRLSHAASADLLALYVELDAIELSNITLDNRVCRLTNKRLSNKDFYSISFRHLQVDELARLVWTSVIVESSAGWLSVVVSPLMRDGSDTSSRAWPRVLRACWMKMLTTCFSLATGPARSGGSSDLASLTKTLSPSLTCFTPASQASNRPPSPLQSLGISGSDRRNNPVFNSEDEALHTVTRRCLADVRLWASRCHNSASASVLINWCITFDPLNVLPALASSSLSPPPLSLCNGHPMYSGYSLLMFRLA
jgi:hypothetical protein